MTDTKKIVLLLIIAIPLAVFSWFSYDHIERHRSQKRSIMYQTKIDSLQTTIDSLRTVLRKKDD